ncbi:MAG TPA: GtrA family protein [Clostridiaceae bacterium]|nr:GtrA family protein [Clostridiaceae bacterium]
MDKIKRLFKIKIKEIKRFFTFSIIGIINTCVDFGIFMLSTKVLGFHYGISQVISYSCATINSFLLNSILTFGDVKRTNAISIQFVKFVTVNISSLAVSVLCLKLCIDVLGISNVISKVITMVISFAINFLGYKTWVFKNVAAFNKKDPDSF